MEYVAIHILRLFRIYVYLFIFNDCLYFSGHTYYNSMFFLFFYRPIRVALGGNMIKSNVKYPNIKSIENRVALKSHWVEI